MLNLATNNIATIEITKTLDKSFTRHIKNVASHLRQCDYNEVKAASGGNPYDTVMESVEISTRKCIVMKTERLEIPHKEVPNAYRLLYIPVILFGIVSHPDDATTGIPWMVATDNFNKISKYVAKQSRTYIDEMKKGYKYMLNFVDQRNVVSIEWLKSCGFTVHGAIEYGAEKRMFHLFDMEVAENV